MYRNNSSVVPVQLDYLNEQYSDFTFKLVELKNEFKYILRKLISGNCLFFATD